MMTLSIMNVLLMLLAVVLTLLVAVGLYTGMSKLLARTVMIAESEKKEIESEN